MVHDTSDLAERINQLWEGFRSGKMTAQEARTHIGFARTLLDTKKVEIAAAHLNAQTVPAVEFNGRKAGKTIEHRARRAATN